MDGRKREILSLTIGFTGSLLGLYGVVLFNRFILLSLPLGVRMVSAIPVYLLAALVPFLTMLANKDKLTDYGFTKTRPVCSIIVGLCIGISMSCVLTLLPHMLGFGAYVDNGHRYRYLWQFAYDFVYCIAAIGLTEEFVFRGFVYEKLKRISQKEMVALVGSSALFGVFHLFSGNIIQMVVTACIGALFCCCRLKIRHCSTLSLIIAHGVYDALITVWASLLL